MENKSKYQKFVIETINRNCIKNADYNPRIIDEDARKKLKKGLKEHGLISAITWNKRTGNVVGGHQRLDVLDSLERKRDYFLDVCVIDVDEREEAVLNVQLNNPSMQGEWDLDKLANMSIDFDLDFVDLGFSKLDIDFMFDGDERFTELFETPEAVDTEEKLKEIKEARAEANEKMEQKNNINFYAMIVFEDEHEKKEFYKKINTPIYEEYLSLSQIKRIKE